MPQASAELQNKMEAYFGDAIDDKGPTTFLENQGYKLLRGWIWRLPNPHHLMTQQEKDCIQFLIDEWDFGGVE